MCGLVAKPFTMTLSPNSSRAGHFVDVFAHPTSGLQERISDMTVKMPASRGTRDTDNALPAFKGAA